MYVSRKRQLHLMPSQTKYLYSDLISTSYIQLLAHVVLFAFILETYHVASIRVVKHFKYLLPVQKDHFRY